MLYSIIHSNTILQLYRLFYILFVGYCGQKSLWQGGDLFCTVSKTFRYVLLQICSDNDIN